MIKKIYIVLDKSHANKLFENRPNVLNATIEMVQHGACVVELRRTPRGRTNYIVYAVENGKNVRRVAREAL